MIAIQFDRKLTTLLKYILNGESKPLNEIKDYFIRVEFQLRGSPHYHMVFWVSRICDLNVECLDNNPGIAEYIDHYIFLYQSAAFTCSLCPEHNEVMSQRSSETWGICRVHKFYTVKNDERTDGRTDRQTDANLNAN